MVDTNHARFEFDRDRELLVEEQSYCDFIHQNRVNKMLENSIGIYKTDTFMNLGLYKARFADLSARMFVRDDEFSIAVCEDVLWVSDVFFDNILNTIESMYSNTV